MQEQTRMVRAISEDTERPYFRIRYRLSVSGRSMLQDALNGNLGRAGEYSYSNFNNDDAMEVDEEFGGYGFHGRPLRQRRSKSVIVGKTTNNQFNNLGGFGFQTQPQTSELPTTPRTQHKMPHTAAFSWDTNEFKNESEDKSPEETAPPPTGIKRTNSTGMLEMEVNRYGSPSVPLHQLRREEKSVLKGLVTCLNSKNVKKYSIGQRYRRGVIYGIDEEQGKIIVLHKDMPAGALCIMRSGNAKRYEKGYPVEDAFGNRLGTVHAIDRLQGLLVLNTTMADKQIMLD
mmetsp:Transcript_35449/g.43782  ORF Transcript_35449/g.43782 Transcript_35449/m.43782 type:complete len:287 (+) Transcript_35449:277-1137(+)|eukprot:CAMPEP_0204827456 /NCGR_PEP_ID=MMETSP1346-20131115/4915_1 /ASSEMBLY_ACC=CAM_ASM_000771 /TAXON_ID=215587 /ORGANISM="Aplanochytrium stocchinoi, Strain GSBS06" /LENGTH=286 /DNA_ID=CAMNT_0051955891 /DNA_START=178 /DNA_END=1038 /DNA_ORIENTATION=-